MFFFAIYTWEIFGHLNSLGKKQSPNISATPITAMGCRQCLSLSVVQLKGKYWEKPHCGNRVVDTFRHGYIPACDLSMNA